MKSIFALLIIAAGSNLYAADCSVQAGELASQAGTSLPEVRGHEGESGMPPYYLCRPIDKIYNSKTSSYLVQISCVGETGSSPLMSYSVKFEDENVCSAPVVVPK